MKTQRVGYVDLDVDRIAQEISLTADFAYSDAYSEYVCGGPWSSCMLWAAGGENGTGLVTEYDFDQMPSKTKYGAQLPYLTSLVEQHFHLETLTFARLAAISDSVIIPHRDLMELQDVPEQSRNVHRIHIPLVTNRNCFFMENDTVYRMHPGEIWFFDAASWHSAASLSPEKRYHLVMDFREVKNADEILKFAPDGAPGIPVDRVVRRVPMPGEEKARLLQLASLINEYNYRDIFSLIIKSHYLHDGGKGFIWRTFLDIVDASGRKDVRDLVADLHRYFLIERTA